MKANFAALLLILAPFCPSHEPPRPPPPAPPPMVCTGDAFSMMAERAYFSDAQGRVLCSFRNDSPTYAACCLEWLDPDTPRIVCRGDADACLVVEP